MMTSIMFPAVIVGGIGLICAIVLVVAAKVMALPADELFDSIRAELPGANCGACGYAGCDDYAKAVAHDGAKTNLCVPGGAGVAAKVSAAMGVAAESVEAKYAVVRCSGNCYATDSVMDYKGKQSCAACNFFYQGKGSCSHGCLGYGDCINACQYPCARAVPPYVGDCAGVRRRRLWLWEKRLQARGRRAARHGGGLQWKTGLRRCWNGFRRKLKAY